MSKVIKRRKTKIEGQAYCWPDLETVLSEIEAAKTLIIEDDMPTSEFDPLVLEAAEKEAGELVSQAKSEADAIREQARKHGFAEGIEQGKASAKDEVETMLTNFRNSIQHFSQLQTKILKESEEEIVNLSLEIARKVIGAELTLDPGTVAKVIRTALTRVSGEQEVTVRVNPVEFEYLQNSPPDFMEQVKLISDPGVERGGAVLDTPSGSLDAQIKEQLMEIEKSLVQGVVAAAGEGE